MRFHRTAERLRGSERARRPTTSDAIVSIRSKKAAEPLIDLIKIPLDAQLQYKLYFLERWHGERARTHTSAVDLCIMWVGAVRAEK